MPRTHNQSLIEPLLDSWDRNSAILLNLLRALPEVVAGLLRRCLDGCAAAQNDEVGKRDLLPAGLRTVEILLDRLQPL